MKKLKLSKKLGTILFYALWPLVWFYSPLRIRVRVLIVYKNEVLLVKNWFGPNIWQFPGGGMKFGESSKETAIREIREELGINLSEKDIKLTNETAVVVHSHGLLLRYQYAVTKIDDRLKLSLSSEITDTKWVKTKEVNLPETVEAYLL